MRKKLAFVMVVLSLILLAAAFWFLKRNVYSKEVLRIEILGPAEAELAGEVDYIVKYKNNGNIRLEEPRLVFEFPEYTEIISNGGSGERKNSLRQEKELDDIYPGEEKTVSFKGRLLGKENAAKTAKAWLSYRPKNIIAQYESATTFTTIIKSVPLTFEFDIPSKVEPGKESLFRVNYFSNLNYPLSGLRVKVEYPSGFEFVESLPRALGGNEWDIPLLNKTEGGRIGITGKLGGEIGETKIFRASLGLWKGEKFILLKEITRGIEIARPSIFISMKINDLPEYIANPGDYLHYDISFKNTGEKVFEDLFLVVQLEKDIFDFDTVQSGLGQVQKEAGSIIWDHNTMPQLKFLPGMEEGKVEFYIKLKEELPQSPLIRTKISLSFIREEFINKINTELALLQKGYFNQGPFKNSGPLPPQVGQQTTYTVSWQVKNAYSDVKNLKIVAVLPPQVRLTGEFAPPDARLTFDQQSREIIWEIGDLLSKEASPEVFFQIAFMPDISQKDEIVGLVVSARAIGEDVWTGKTVESDAVSVSTDLPDDPSVSESQGVVQ
ncbi:MAG: hypothetical protein A3H01_02300 [Candidatus Wildermuthbacteria bacterium RIFCSPLOWO2_12_FULL_40_9]|uniref:DUF11 domain-containing protein n=2 Tax=Candidatus Wildermuthiibacteriota TaxID=1817923 RepID=A0A1G2RDJ8_9BACT|nr:MAG: hypothetical protein A3F15_01270 [Candidatus Wildermuthbacteria bacterium RIFCSPHIGHO2_12_FULL_40_12]OHA76925.1 MAG: hypothetical protein A3H01_02300 [Candidatus Wildermuthbacteria bacterium RIFCSPLOWO2_12_FULL_40_9]